MRYPRATSKALLAKMAGIRQFFPADGWPAVLPLKAGDPVRPLVVGIDQALVVRIVVPDSMTAEEAAREVRHAVGYLTRSYPYCRAMAAPGAMRHGIDGEPVEPVSPEHAGYALKQLPDYKPGKPDSKKQPPHLATGAVEPMSKESITVLVSSIKVTLPIKSDQLRPVGETVKSVDLTLELGDGKPFIVPISGKAYRRAMRQVAEMAAGGGEVIVLLQGRLVAGHKIEGAGLSVQAKAQKAGD